MNSPVMLMHGDALEMLRQIPDDSVHAIITDPPYGLSNLTPAATADAIGSWINGYRELVPVGKGFMGRDWDSFVPPPAVWDECYRVLKPGGHMAVFAGSRTVDLMGISIRLAGFEMRDSIAAWLYGSGFPKSHDVGKALDKAAGATREVVGEKAVTRDLARNGRTGDEALSPVAVTGTKVAITAPATDKAREWDGWGTALKPAHEPILIARKPFSGTIASNVLEHGTGAIHVDACRVAGEARPKMVRTGTFVAASSMSGELTETGRWPTNVVLAHHPDCGPDEDPGPCVPDCQVAALDKQSGTLTSGTPAAHHKRTTPSGNGETHGAMAGVIGHSFGDTGGASRFFPSFRYQAKAPKKERPQIDGKGHPTVKPLGLIRWLDLLLVPEGGTVLDPFSGTGPVGEVATGHGHPAILIERDDFSVQLIEKRLYGDAAA